MTNIKHLMHVPCLVEQARFSDWTCSHGEQGGDTALPPRLRRSHHRGRGCPALVRRLDLDHSNPNGQGVESGDLNSSPSEVEARKT